MQRVQESTTSSRSNVVAITYSHGYGSWSYDIPNTRGRSLYLLNVFLSSDPDVEQLDEDGAAFVWGHLLLI